MALTIVASKASGNTHKAFCARFEFASQLSLHVRSTSPGCEILELALPSHRLPVLLWRVHFATDRHQQRCHRADYLSSSHLSIGPILLSTPFSIQFSTRMINRIVQFSMLMLFVSSEECLSSLAHSDAMVSSSIHNITTPSSANTRDAFAANGCSPITCSRHDYVPFG